MTPLRRGCAAAWLPVRPIEVSQECFCLNVSEWDAPHSAPLWLLMAYDRVSGAAMDP